MMRSTTLAGAAFTVAAAISTSMLGTPHASATESWDLWNMINNAHTAAGCPTYQRADALANVALHLAQNMVANNGNKNSPPAEQLLSQQGYNTSSFGEMDNFDNVDPRNILSTLPYPPTPGSPKDKAAMEFWQSHNTKDLFPNCGMKAMEVAVWENGNNWAAVSLMGTQK